MRNHRERNINFLFSTLRYRRRHRKGPDRTILKCINRTGARIYSNYQQIPKILGRMGLVIISISRGILTNRETRLKRIGGEILCYIW